MERETYEKQTRELDNIYKSAFRKIITIIILYDLLELSQHEAEDLEEKINETLVESEEKAKEWVDKTIDFAWLTGVAITLLGIGRKGTIDDLRSVARRQPGYKSKGNSYARKQLKAATYDDLLMMTRNTRREVKRVIRQIVAENMKGKEVSGTAAKVFRKQIIKDLRKELLSAVDFAIVDRAGKRWSIEQYSKMIARTKIMQAQLDATISQALFDGAYYGVISSHGSKHASCRIWEGRTVKLTPEAPGNYPLISDLRARGSGIFHPNCKHHVLPTFQP